MYALDIKAVKTTLCFPPLRFVDFSFYLKSQKRTKTEKGRLEYTVFSKLEEIVLY